MCWGRTSHIIISLYICATPPSENWATSIDVYVPPGYLLLLTCPAWVGSYIKMFMIAEFKMAAKSKMAAIFSFKNRHFENKQLLLWPYTLVGATKWCVIFILVEKKFTFSPLTRNSWVGSTQNLIRTLGCFKSTLFLNFELFFWYMVAIDGKKAVIFLTNSGGRANRF
jgi:hypothetical protein